ncbi:DUF262 domain-containing HNH endonuclease family protein [Leisingera aquaemixtae]|uniref:DUF262 domain-containing protein n=1 Tax=Leisingera aquaemixtae TaxID=1396826 RepID=UPI0021A721FC|nr:DUF262 domain-containing HNH endonuclease family protein [Leisingera aquaemixtae]UWQ36905.1 DUF262 domain-containing HNH endonuclease family protein [Leisingera aquaemixtae]
MKIESHDVSLEKLLQGNYFQIPKFQRPYSWEAEQINEFWSDVNSNLGETYFIGSMVVYETKSGKLAVVDGQQRLTTIAIFLSAIRDQFFALDSENSAIGLQQFIERKNVDNQDVFVLETESSYPYLQERIFKVGQPEIPLEIGSEEKAISSAFESFTKKLKAKVDTFFSDPSTEDLTEKKEAALDWLRLLRKTLLSLSIILVTLDDEDDAYLIFETLNTRGKDLALSDLLKNHFVRHQKSKGSVDHARLKWEKILETVHTSEIDLDPDNFIVHSWQSRYDMVTKGKAFKKIRSVIKKQNAKDHLDMFLTDVGLWRAIFEPGYMFGNDKKEIRRSLSALREFRVVQPVPGILSLLRSNSDGVIKDGKLADALKKIENFHFSFTAVASSRSSGGISGMYSSFGRKLFDCKNSQDAANEIQDLISKLRERVPTATEFDAGFEKILYTKANTSQRALVRYILQKTFSYEGMTAIGESGDLTIEHLYPQAKISGEFTAGVVGQVGNLILVDPKTNDQLGIKPFEEKRKILIDKGYKLPQEFLDADVLSPELIKENTLRISELARTQVWRV